MMVKGIIRLMGLKTNAMKITIQRKFSKLEAGGELCEKILQLSYKLKTSPEDVISQGIVLLEKLVEADNNGKEFMIVYKKC